MGKKGGLGASSKNLSRPRSQNGKQVKKMRKSSLSRARKNFSVFQQQTHENKYENLAPIVGEKGEEEDKHAVIRIHDEGEEPGSEIEEVEVSDSENPEPSLLLEDEKPASGKSLDANDDFIAFEFSEEEAEEGGQESEVKGNAGALSLDKEETLTEGQLYHNLDYPWILNHDHSKQREIADWLTLEMKDFVSYISPNRQEIELRNETISKLKAAIKELWPDADLNCFGSYSTDLYLPGSDIDCVVRSKAGDKENRNSLYSLASFLKRKDLATQVEVIAKARVPIIKFVEPESRIHIDVSFERTNGLEAARIIRAWLQEQPGLRELVLIVKQFLNARRLNNVHNGGLGGYSIICLVYTFLKLHPRILTGDIDPLDNLGVLLIDFFELYGKNFGYDDVAISVAESDAKYLVKDDHPDLIAGRPRFSLVIQDPGDPSNNISRGSFNMRDIKKAFAGAFDLLTNRCFELDSATFKDRVGQSILGNVIKYKGVKRDFNDERALVVNEAIQENEQYHKKRGRIVHDEFFTDMSDMEEEEDIYELDQQPAKKKSKRDKKREKKNKKQTNETKKIEKNRVIVVSEEENDDYDPSKSIEIHEKPISTKIAEENDDGYNPATVDELMGLKKFSDEDDSQEISAVNSLPSDLREEDGDDDLDLKKNSVDKQTKRDYWLSKGQSM